MKHTRLSHLTRTSPSFLKKYICKHIIGMFWRLKYCKPSPEVKNVEIGRKIKRGKPSKAKKSFIGTIIHYSNL